jgi:hypothetical protein
MAAKVLKNALPSKTHNCSWNSSKTKMSQVTAKKAAAIRTTRVITNKCSKKSKSAIKKIVDS